MRPRTNHRHPYVSWLTVAASLAVLAGLWVVRPRGSPPPPVRVSGPGDMEWRACFSDPTQARSLDDPFAALEATRHLMDQTLHRENLHHMAMEHLRDDPRWSVPDQPRYLSAAIASNRALLLDDLAVLERTETTLGCLEEHIGDELEDAAR